MNGLPSYYKVAAPSHSIRLLAVRLSWWALVPNALLVLCRCLISPTRHSTNRGRASSNSVRFLSPLPLAESSDGYTSLVIATHLYPGTSLAHPSHCNFALFALTLCLHFFAQPPCFALFYVVFTTFLHCLFCSLVPAHDPSLQVTLHNVTSRLPPPYLHSIPFFFVKFSYSHTLM